MLNKNDFNLTHLALPEVRATLRRNGVEPKIFELKFGLEKTKDSCQPFLAKLIANHIKLVKQIMALDLQNTYEWLEKQRRHKLVQRKRAFKRKVVRAARLRNQEISELLRQQEARSLKALIEEIDKQATKANKVELYHLIMTIESEMMQLIAEFVKKLIPSLRALEISGKRIFKHYSDEALADFTQSYIQAHLKLVPKFKQVDKKLALTSGRSKLLRAAQKLKMAQKFKATNKPRFKFQKRSFELTIENRKLVVKKDDLYHTNWQEVVVANDKFLDLRNVAKKDTACFGRWMKNSLQVVSPELEAAHSAILTLKPALQKSLEQDIEPIMPLSRPRLLPCGG